MNYKQQLCPAAKRVFFWHLSPSVSVKEAEAAFLQYYLWWVFLCVNSDHRCTNTWLNILGVSVWLFLDLINIWIDRLNKADNPPQYEWPLSGSLKAWAEKKFEQERLCSQCLRVFELGHWSYPVFTLRLGFTSSVLLFFMPQTMYRTGDFSVCTPTWAISLEYSSPDRYR